MAGFREKKYSTGFGKIVVPAGKCYICNKLTEGYCDDCQQFICKKHMVMPSHDSNECYCEKCFEKKKL